MTHGRGKRLTGDIVQKQLPYNKTQRGLQGDHSGQSLPSTAKSVPWTLAVFVYIDWLYDSLVWV